jgi:hypothetical protein
MVTKPAPTRDNRAVRLYGQTRRAWLTLRKLDLVLYIGSSVREKNCDDPYEHDKIYLHFQFATMKRPQFICLSDYTAEELECFRKFMETAVDAARPVCESLDMVAQMELDAGATDLAPRLFRARPVLVIRELKAMIADFNRGRKTPDNKEMHYDYNTGSSDASEGDVDFTGEV